MSSVNTILTMKGFEFISKQSYLTDPGKLNYYLSVMNKELGRTDPKMQTSSNRFSNADLFNSMCIVDKHSILAFSVMNTIDTMTFYAHTVNKMLDRKYIDELIKEFNPNEYSISVIIDNEYMDIRKWTRKSKDSTPEYKETKIYSNVNLIDKAKEFITGEVDEEGNLIVSVDFGKKGGSIAVAEKKPNGDIELLDTNELPNINWTKQQLLDYAEEYSIKVSKNLSKQKILDILLEGE